MRISRPILVMSALVFAACGGNQHSAPSHYLPQASRVPTSDSACEMPGTYFFHGACTTGTFNASGGTIKLTEYEGLTIAMTLPRNSPNGTKYLLLADATGKSDITGTVRGKSFPLYGRTTCYPKKACPGTAFGYVAFDLIGDTTVKLNGNIAWAFTDSNGFPASTRCFSARLTPVGWYPSAKYSGPASSKVTIRYESRYIKTKATVLAFACG